MSSTSIFPLEVEERVIGILAEDEENLLSVQACSLVCRALVPLCRKHIFASIVLNDCDAESPSPTTHMLERLLSKSPEVANYIRKLGYNIVVEDFTSSSIQDCLKRISRLQFLTVWHCNLSKKLDWRSNPLRPALLHLLHLPTLTRFKVFAIDNFIPSDLIPCVNLKKLEIGHHTTGTVEIFFSGMSPSRSIRLNEFASGIRDNTAITSICKARRPDGQPVIDFWSLAKITVVIEMDDDIEASQELFRRCGQLINAHISFWDPEWNCPSLAGMLRPSMQTLRHISISLRVEDVHVDPLFSIPSEFEDMRNKNIIESIIVKVMVNGICRRGQDWGRLDEVLTKPGWFALKQVSLTIEISSYSISAPGLEVALRKLPEVQFPRLSKSGSISFKFEVTRLLV